MRPESVSRLESEKNGCERLFSDTENEPFTKRTHWLVACILRNEAGVSAIRKNEANRGSG
jgi:hypothetical protein